MPFFKAKLFFAILLSAFQLNTSAQENNPRINSDKVILESLKLSQEKKYKEAIEKLSTVSRSDTNYATALLEMANAYYLDSQYNKSIEKCRVGLEMYPEMFSDFKMTIANNYDNLGKTDSAVLIYDEAIKHTPQNYLLYYNRGISNIRRERYDDAKKDLQTSGMLYPYFSQTHYFLGNMYFLEGSFVPALLAYSTYLMMAPEGKFNTATVQMMNGIAKVTDEVSGLAKAKSSSTERSFNEVQEILLSKIALDAKYKSKVDIDDNIIKQLQVVIEKLEFKKSDKGFAMQYYVPLFVDLQKKGMFPSMIYTMFSGFDLKEIKNWNQKNKSQKDAFISYASAYFDGIKFSHELDYEKRGKAEERYVYDGSRLIGFGAYKVTKTETLPYGKWTFYNDLYKVSSEGSFLESGKKTGNWNFYHRNGVKKENYTYKDGLIEGKGTTWFDNGVISMEENYKNGQYEGLQKLYYYNGILKSSYNYKNNKREGEALFYDYKGNITSKANYKNDEYHGPYATYFSNGKLKDEGAYENGTENGEYTSYYNTGEVKMKGMVKNSLRQGLWIEYHLNGKEKARTVYLDNEITGEFSEYYDNGVMSTKGNYVKKKLDGKVLYFDTDGVKYNEIEYDRGRLREITFFDKKGNVTSTTTTRKGAAKITFYNAEGVKWMEGFFDKDGLKQNTFYEYFGTGGVSVESNWKDGELHGAYTKFEPNGNVTYKSSYKNGKENGYVKSYYNNGNISEEGWVEDDNRQDTWISYNIVGDVYSKTNFLYGNPNGFKEFYYPNNILDYEYRYKTDWIVAMKQYDTLGNIITRQQYPDGNGSLIFKHLNGKTYSKTEFKNYMLNGLKESYFFDGKLVAKTNYVNDEKEGPSVQYNYDGKITSEGTYKNNEKDGAWKYYYRNGQLSKEEIYKNGEIDGEQKLYDKPGNLVRINTFKNGIVDGPMNYYGENKQIALVLNFVNGYLKSYQYPDKNNVLVEPIPLKSNSGKITGYYPNGKKSVVFEYKENNVEGEYIFYYMNGNIRQKGKMRNGFYEGLNEWFYVDGKKHKSENYLMGNLHGKTLLFYPDGKSEGVLNYYVDDMHGENIYYKPDGKAVKYMYYYGYLTEIKEQL